MKNKSIPYFYIIRHKPSGMLYAGSKYGKDANPDNFMQPFGYHTSSKTKGGVLDLIEKDGLDSFEILKIVIQDECGDVYAYETEFLKENDICNKSNWLNCHNNMGKFAPADRKKAQDTYFERTGYRTAPANPEVQKKMKIDQMAKSGYESSNQVPEVKEKKKRTLLQRTGYANPMQNPETNKKASQTYFERTGYANPSQNPEVKEKKRLTALARKKGMAATVRLPNCLTVIECFSLCQDQ